MLQPLEGEEPPAGESCCLSISAQSEACFKDYVCHHVLVVFRRWHWSWGWLGRAEMVAPGPFGEETDAVDDEQTDGGREERGQVEEGDLQEEQDVAGGEAVDEGGFVYVWMNCSRVALRCRTSEDRDWRPPFESKGQGKFGDLWISELPRGQQQSRCFSKAGDEESLAWWRSFMRTATVSPDTVGK